MVQVECRYVYNVYISSIKILTNGKNKKMDSFEAMPFQADAFHRDSYLFKLFFCNLTIKSAHLQRINRTRRLPMHLVSVTHADDFTRYISYSYGVTKIDILISLFLYIFYSKLENYCIHSFRESKAHILQYYMLNKHSRSKLPKTDMTMEQKVFTPEERRLMRC
jgi:hypothetical protein